MHVQLDRTASKTRFTLGEIFHVFLVPDSFYVYTQMREPAKWKRLGLVACPESEVSALICIRIWILFSDLLLCVNTCELKYPKWNKFGNNYEFRKNLF